MTSSARLTAICFGLVTSFACTASAFAQAPPASPQPPEVGHAAIALTGSVNPWDAIQWVERRYKIEALRFKARDETGVDWWGSDEVMIETRDAKGWTVSGEIGGIDSGDTHHFDPAKSCIVAVHPGVVVLGKTSVCNEVGEPGPLWFTVEFWEKDLLGSPTPGFCVATFPGPDRHAGPHCVNDNNGDVFIGRARLDFSPQVLGAALPNVGDEHIETIVLFPCTGNSVCAGPFLPDYTFTFRVTRVHDARVDLRSVLDEAMRTTGARSEIEAIAAGLRSLRAPSARKFEAEARNP